MTCPNCNAALENDEKFCPYCGCSVQKAAEIDEAPASRIDEPVSAPEPEAPAAPPAPPSYAAPVQPHYSYMQQPGYNQPSPQADYTPKFKPLSPWAYVGYNILFAIPVIGLILLIVFSFDDENINRRNYARSFFCALLIGILVFIISLVLLFVFGFSLASIAGLAQKYAGSYT
ncbi:MAG: zinc-ribbon domain-containing protein [Clostridia bacterium]|nr:zinc-ribbon domain-containing protein [Clostridia bacterium]